MMLMMLTHHAHKGKLKLFQLEAGGFNHQEETIKSSFGKAPIISKTSINTQQESKEIFRMKILEKADKMYGKIRPRVA